MQNLSEIKEQLEDTIHSPLCDEDIQDVVAKVFMRIPYEDRLELANVHFLIPRRSFYWRLLVRALPDVPRPIQLVCIDPRQFEGGEDQAIYTVAHELAHAFLGHTGTGEGVESAIEEERETDRQVIAWGFEKELRECPDNYLFGKGIENVFGS